MEVEMEPLFYEAMRILLYAAELTQNSVLRLYQAEFLQNGATLTQLNCWIKSLFLLSLRTKSILLAL